MKRGDIYWIDADAHAEGSEYRKTRPGVIVSNDKANEHSGVVSVVYLTRKHKHHLPTHVYLEDTETGLFFGSTVKCEAVYTVDKRRVQAERPHSRVLPEDMDRIDRAVAIGLGLTLPGEPLTADESDFKSPIEELTARVNNLVSEVAQGRKRTVKIEIVEE